MMTAGMFVDIFIANWDVIGLGKDNVIIDVNGKLTRIDPVGSLTFRAQGGKKAGRFNSKANELSTMTNPNSGSGIILSKANAKQAAETFLSVSWEEIYTALTKINNYILSNTNNENFQNLRNEWNKEYNHIASILHKRHKVITNHANFVLNEHIHTLENIIMENVKIILRSLL